jgi:hypothetical protein
VLFIREIDPDKSERILAILFDKEVSRTTWVNTLGRFWQNRDQAIPILLASVGRNRTRFRFDSGSDESQTSRSPAKILNRIESSGLDSRIRPNTILHPWVLKLFIYVRAFVLARVNASLLCAAAISLTRLTCIYSVLKKTRLKCHISHNPRGHSDSVAHT